MILVNNELVATASASVHAFERWKITARLKDEGFDPARYRKWITPTKVADRSCNCGHQSSESLVQYARQRSSCLRGLCRVTLIISWYIFFVQSVGVQSYPLQYFLVYESKTEVTVF